MTSELRECPFCAGNAAVDHIQNKWFASCADNDVCPAYIVNTPYATRREAIAAWNTRQHTPDMDDTARLDWLRSECNDVRWHSDSCDGVIVEIVSHHQGAPHERLEGMNCNEDLRAAIDEAMQGLVRKEDYEQPPTPADYGRLSLSADNTALVEADMLAAAKVLAAHDTSDEWEAIHPTVRQDYLDCAKQAVTAALSNEGKA